MSSFFFASRILELLRIYKDVSGQEVNFSKSAITFSKGIFPAIRQYILQTTKISRIGRFRKYLGLSECVDRNKTDTFSYLVQRMVQKLESWYSKLLSPAGKEVLIKAVLTSLPTYCMSCFLLPKQLIARLTAVTRRFFFLSAHQDHIKTSWISWNQITQLKQFGGLGIRDLRDFNIALLAKQIWRLIQQPESLLAKIYKAKYYPKTTLLEAKQKRSSSYDWKSILQGNKLLKQGIKWTIGNGRIVNVWRDKWIPANPATTPEPLQTIVDPNLKVNALFLRGTASWDTDRLNSLFHPLDIPLIQSIRPSVTDRASWLHTSNGAYTMKSGYSLLRTSQGQSSNMPNTLFTSLWKFQLPPKIQHFWWRVLHNAILVATKLKQRKILNDATCSFCGEHDENLNHLLFNCRVSKEIWELAPIGRPNEEEMSDNGVIANYEAYLKANQDISDNVSLIHFLGWHIWKQRNEVIFNYKRLPIPLIINKAVENHKEWFEATALERINESTVTDSLHFRAEAEARSRTLNQLFERCQQSCCLVDASWTSPSDKIGIGWTLYNSHHQQVLIGSGSFPPTQSSKVAEIEALRMAVVELQRLSYRNITFCGDLRKVYQLLQRGDMDMKSEETRYLPYIVQLQDIVRISRLCNFKFLWTSRKANDHSDHLAKQSRIHSQSYIIKWPM